MFQRYDKAQLWVCGTGNEEERLRRMAHGHAGIRFIGHCTEQQLKSFYRGTVAVIVPSVNYEMFPLVILEAFREKTPVIVRNLGEMPESVEDSGGGFVYDTDEDLITAMDGLLDNPSLRKGLGLRGYRACRQEWSSDVHVKRYLELITEIAASRSKSR